jgi:outer membrane lipoprotein-sorting protein
MLGKRRRPAVLAVLATALLLTSSVAGIAAAHQSSTIDAQSDETDGDEVVDSFLERIETLETVEFERTTESTYDGETATNTDRVAVDLDDFQKRIDTVDSSFGSNTTTVVNESTSVIYDPAHDTVSEFTVSGEQILLPRLEQLANESVLSYEFGGTETVDGRSAYVLEAVPEREVPEDTELSMTVYVDTETHFPIRVASESVTDDAEYSSTVTYRNVTVNEGIPDTRFELDLPDDVSTPTRDSPPEISTYDSYTALDANASVALPDAELADGFTFDGGTVISSDDRYSVFTSYSDGEQSVSVTVSADSSSGIDRSDYDRFEAVEIGDTTGYVYDGDDYASVYWTDAQSYTVSGDISAEQAVDIAESIAGE